MRGRAANVTAAELAVLKLLWQRGPSKVRELCDRLYPGGGASHYATVQKLLERLEAKGCVRREQRDRVNVFLPAIDRSELVARRLRETAEQLCDGSLTPLLTHLAGSADLTREELTSLRELVDGRDGPPAREERRRR